MHRSLFVATTTFSIVIASTARADDQATKRPPLAHVMARPSSPTATTTLASTSTSAASGGAADPASVMLPDVASFHLKNPNEMVTFTLEDADINELVRAIGDITGKRFVFASTKLKTFKATIFSPQKISISEAYQAFLALLQANGLTVIPERDFLKIVDAQDVQREVTPILREGEAPPPEERYVTEIHRLAHVSAEDAASLLAKFQSRDGTIVPFAPDNLLIMTDTGANLRRMKRILDEVDVAGGEADRVWFEPLHYASSIDVQKKLAELLDLKDAKDAVRANVAGILRVSKIVAIDRPNALAIVGTEGAYARTLELVRKLDVPFGGDGEMHVVALQHSEAKKLVTALNDALGASGGSVATPSAAKPGGASQASGSSAGVLEGAVRLSAEETTNSILITASPRDFASIRNVIAALDIPRRQVFIEAVVMDLSVDTTNQLGVAWHGAKASGASSVFGGFNPEASILTTGDLQGLALNVRGPEITIPSALQKIIGFSSIPSFGALLTAVATSGKTDILSTPSILATDNTPAELHVQLNTPSQKNVPSLASAATAAAGTGLSALSLGGLGTTTPSMLQIGPKIKITPHLNDSDEVRLDVDETISDVAANVDGGTLGTVSFTERGAKTTLTVRDQQTVVIGGLVRDQVTRTETKIPILGDLPLLGALFRTTEHDTTKSNLVLVLTPYIIREQDDLRRIFERKERERQVLIDHEYLFGATHYDPPRESIRQRGILQNIRHAQRELDDQEKLDALRAPRPVLAHPPQAPLEMPMPPARTWSTGSAPTSTPGVKGTTNAQVHAPAVIERVEK